MKRSNLNLIIDIIAFAGFVALTTTGVLMRYLLPPGSGRFSTIWGLDRHEWGGIHFWLSIIFFSILALHLILHWRWLFCTITGRPKEGSGLRLGLGIVGLLTVIALSMAPLLAPIENKTNSKKSSFLSGQNDQAVFIRGSMSLMDIEETVGVPALYIADALKLPKSISLTKKLGLLAQTYDFKMNNVRDIVKEYKQSHRYSSE